MANHLTPTENARHNTQKPGRFIRSTASFAFAVASVAVFCMGAQLVHSMPQAVAEHHASHAPQPVQSVWQNLATTQPQKLTSLSLSAEMRAVRDWVSSHYNVTPVKLNPILEQVEVSARKYGFDPLLIVAMMAVESSFNPKAQSPRGAQGLMQVIPRYHMDKISQHDGEAEEVLFDPKINIQIGTQVLAEGMQRYGTLRDALQYYGGARKDPKSRYSERVLRMKNRLATIVERDLQQDA